MPPCGTALLRVVSTVPSSTHTLRLRAASQHGRVTPEQTTHGATSPRLQGLRLLLPGAVHAGQSALQALHHLHLARSHVVGQMHSPPRSPAPPPALPHAHIMHNDPSDPTTHGHIMPTGGVTCETPCAPIGASSWRGP